MKRVKRGPKEVVGEKGREGEDLGAGRRPRVRRRNSKAGDTLHPRALARDRWDPLFLQSLSLTDGFLKEQFG